MKLVFDPGALEDLRYWVQTESKSILIRTNQYLSCSLV